VGRDDLGAGVLDGRDACLSVERWRGRRGRGEEAEERDEDRGDQAEEPEASRNVADDSLRPFPHAASLAA
jgi:hypothetical protein